MPTMTTNGRNVRIENRSRIAAQNLMEGDVYLMRGEPNLVVDRIRRSEENGTVIVTFNNGTKRKFEWDDRVSIVETPERHRYRRNSLRRKGYRNYMTVCATTRAAVVSTTPTPKRKPKSKPATRR